MNVSKAHIAKTKKKVEYHPRVRKMVPKPIMKIAEDYSVEQYILLTIILGAATIVIPVVALAIYNLYFHYR